MENSFAMLIKYIAFQSTFLFLSFFEANSIYIVLFIALSIWIGLFGFLLSLDKRIKKIETELKEFNNE